MYSQFGCLYQGQISVVQNLTLLLHLLRHKIHELIDGQADKTIYRSDYAFRLIFNGNILTPLISGCPGDAELCDVTQLLEIVDPYTNEAPDCSVPTAADSADPLVVKTKKLMSTK